MIRGLLDLIQHRKRSSHYHPTVYELTEAKDLTPETNPDNSLLEYLQSRHLIESITDDNLYKLTKRGSNHKFKLYCGVDPTASSLHLGNLLPLMVLLHFKMSGNDVVGLVGGATGLVGDPSGGNRRNKIMKLKLKIM